MTGALPFFPQVRYDTCALACLRTLLAHYGTPTTEDELVQAAKMEEGGVDIEELARLAERYGLRAEIRQLPPDALADLLARDRFAVIYLNRFPMDGQFAVHAVIPIRVTAHFVTLLDPRVGQRRVSKGKFMAAQRYLAHYGVVCGPVDSFPS